MLTVVGAEAWWSTDGGEKEGRNFGVDFVGSSLSGLHPATKSAVGDDQLLGVGDEQPKLQYGKGLVI
jgi:hypothetical protein